MSDEKKSIFVVDKSAFLSLVAERKVLLGGKVSDAETSELSPGESRTLKELRQADAELAAASANALFWAAVDMIEAQDRPKNGNDGGAQERADAWVALRKAVSNIVRG